MREYIEPVGYGADDFTRQRSALPKNAQERQNRETQRRGYVSNSFFQFQIQLVNTQFGGSLRTTDFRGFSGIVTIVSYVIDVIYYDASYIRLIRHILSCRDRESGLVSSKAVYWTDTVHNSSSTVLACAHIRLSTFSPRRSSRRTRGPRADPEARRQRKRSRRVSRTYLACRKRQVDRWRNNWPLISRANLKESERDVVGGERGEGLN